MKEYFKSITFNDASNNLIKEQIIKSFFFKKKKTINYFKLVLYGRMFV